MAAGSRRHSRGRGCRRPSPHPSVRCVAVASDVTAVVQHAARVVGGWRDLPAGRHPCRSGPASAASVFWPSALSFSRPGAGPTRQGVLPVDLPADRLTAGIRSRPRVGPLRPLHRTRPRLRQCRTQRHGVHRAGVAVRREWLSRLEPRPRQQRGTGAAGHRTRGGDPVGRPRARRRRPPGPRAARPGRRRRLARAGPAHPASPAPGAVRRQAARQRRTAPQVVPLRDTAASAAATGNVTRSRLTPVCRLRAPARPRVGHSSRTRPAVDASLRPEQPRPVPPPASSARHDLAPGPPSLSPHPEPVSPSPSATNACVIIGR